MVFEVAVIGAGVIGLSSAISLQERLRDNVHVTIIADNFTRHTVSHGAGGLFCPEAKGTDPALEERWSRDAAKHFFSLAFSKESENSGVCLVSGYDLQNYEAPNKYLKYMPFCEKASPAILEQFRDHYKYGYFYTTAIVEGPKYLPYLMNRFASNGGRVVQRRIESFSEISDQYDVIVNCTGFGSQKLANDPTLIPVRGQLVRVSAPWIKHFIHGDDNRYILPVADTAAIGGEKGYGITDTTIDPPEGVKVLEELTVRFPALHGAKVLYEWVGLRPTREPVRVEIENVSQDGKTFQVVHNYGHGAYGISLSWGTGVHTAELVEECLRKKSKL